VRWWLYSEAVEGRDVVGGVADGVVVGGEQQAKVQAEVLYMCGGGGVLNHCYT
jgi:hypothetical protein